MSIDEKQVDKEMFTILSNRKTGKMALMAETLKVKALLSLTDKFSTEKRWAVKTMTCDLSPSYHWFIRQAFIRATPIADKFHIIKHALDALNDHRIRLKQSYFTAWRNRCEKEGRKIQHLKLQNGETALEQLSRSRYLLFKQQQDWTSSQRTRATLLFKTYPPLQQDYRLIISFRDWYDKSNIGQETSYSMQRLLIWYEQVHQKASDEIKNFQEMIEDHQAKIIPCFKEGKTNAQAENLNKRIQSFIQSNYGVRDKDFFLWRCKQYFS